ncbi:hypothetical protein [Rheinheimera sp.]|uniref:hypothetical protein n=1 Tax=Rheinheimera sp. TaxID=1869214 RepID=UPI0027B914A5|nr:hypothetical protein [Rheinheimera sp.]
MPSYLCISRDQFAICAMKSGGHIGPNLSFRLIQGGVYRLLFSPGFCPVAGQPCCKTMQQWYQSGLPSVMVVMPEPGVT